MQSIHRDKTLCSHFQPAGAELRQAPHMLLTNEMLASAKASSFRLSTDTAGLFGYKWSFWRALDDPQLVQAFFIQSQLL
jgi:hypothetical protein